MDLLIQLKKISSAEVRAILTPQPQIAYSLFQLMVQLDVVDLDSLNRTLTAQQPAPAAPIQSSPPLVAPAPVTPPQAVGQLLHSRPAMSELQFPGGLAKDPSALSHRHPGEMMMDSLPPGVSQDLLAAIPDDQRAMLMQVISMTPAQIEQLPPTERATFTQLRQAVGLPM